MPNSNDGLFSVAAVAAACDPGYYLEDGACVECLPGMAAYCPDGINKIDCPENTTDYGSSIKGAVIERSSVRGALNRLLTRAEDCHADVYLDAPAGKMLWQCDYDGVGYLSCGQPLWYAAKVGYYLSDYHFTSWEVWYGSVKPCTNAPRHARYTGVGTPDGNDCLWECDVGYDCQRQCSAGIAELRAGNGMSVKLWDRKATARSLVIRYNDRVCYVNMDAGTRDGAINVLLNGVTYHLAD